jgi:hypothetical protein
MNHHAGDMASNVCRADQQKVILGRAVTVNFSSIGRSPRDSRQRTA